MASDDEFSSLCTALNVWLMSGCITSVCRSLNEEKVCGSVMVVCGVYLLLKN